MGEHHEMTARVRAAAERAIDRWHVPGISIGVVRGDDLAFCEGFGEADIESGQPMDPARRHCIGSITKTMVGLCLMALIDEERLQLEDRVVDLLSEVRFDGPASTMTLRHLLTHSSGIGEAPTPDRLIAAVRPDAGGGSRATTFESSYPDGIVIECEPGTKWHYANHGFVLLGEIVRRAEGGAELEDILQHRIFRPLGMRASDALGAASPLLTTPYHRPPGEDARFQLARAGVEVQDEPTVDGHNIRGDFAGETNKAFVAAGDVQSTVPDMARYASALLRQGGGIVRPQTFAAMIAPQWCPDERLVNWGLSFCRYPRYGRTIIGHGGAYFGGWSSHLAFLPDENIGIIQHMNVMMDEAWPVFHSIWRAVLGVGERAIPGTATDAAVLATAPGLYELPPGRLTNQRPAVRIGRVEIARDGGGLTLRSRWGAWKHGVRLRPCGGEPDLFAIVEGDDEPAHIVLVRDGNGAVTGLRCDDLVHMRRA